MTYILIIFSALLASCSNFNHRQSESESKSEIGKHRTDSQIRRMQQRAQLSRDQSEREMFLNKRRSLGAVEIHSVPQKKKNTVEMQTPNSLKKLAEGQLFAELADRYQAQDRWGFEVRYRLFLRKFPRSTRVDEAYYMKALMELAERNYGVSLIALNKILKSHPYSKKAPAALFAKGIVYKKMNLPKIAKSTLSEVGRQYPGSPESLRAQNELKLLRK